MTRIHITCLFLLLTNVTGFHFAGCSNRNMSTITKEPSRGFNGSFEHTKGGLPVNWQFYTSLTVPSGDFDVSSDTANAKEGTRSVLFTVRECDSAGGWHSPGLATEIPARPGQVYRVSFWIQNMGTQFRARIAGISATEGQAQLIVQTDETSAAWRQYEHIYQVPENMNAIRFEVSILKPGIFRIDDVRLDLLK